jgi:hypothetical protein
MFAELVDAASVGHADIGICRSVIKSLPRRWVRERIEPIVKQLIDASPHDYEVFRSAELYDELDDELLARLIRLASSSESDAVRDVAADFSRITSSD